MFLGGRIFREFPVDGDGFGVPMVLLVQPREFQQPIAIVRVEWRGPPEMRHGTRQPVLPDLCVRQAQFGRGRFRIQIQSGAVLLLGLGGIARFEQRLGPIQPRTEFLGLPIHGRLQIFGGGTRLLIADEQDANSAAADFASRSRAARYCSSALAASPDSSSAWAQYSRGRNSLGFRSTAGCR